MGAEAAAAHISKMLLTLSGASGGGGRHQNTKEGRMKYDDCLLIKGRKEGQMER